jgi:hypothetical protein
VVQVPIAAKTRNVLGSSQKLAGGESQVTPTQGSFLHWPESQPSWQATADDV